MVGKLIHLIGRIHDKRDVAGRLHEKYAEDRKIGYYEINQEQNVWEKHAAGKLKQRAPGSRQICWKEMDKQANEMKE